jgi:thioredoxin reductase (NADPH)
MRAAEARKPVRLKLYGRTYCHLCEDMQRELQRLSPELNLALEVIDVDRSEALEARYGELVPVLVHDDTEICHYFLDHAALAALLARLSTGSAEHHTAGH